ncbi:MAG: occludin [Bacteroides sp.]
MKRIGLFLALLGLMAGSLRAQTELPTDSIARLPDPNVKDFGGFLLDMRLMPVVQAPKLPHYDLTKDLFAKDYSQLFRFDPPGIMTSKNGWRIRTYGTMTPDWRRVPTPGALPWEKNRYEGAFELKSANGTFGLRIEVKQRGNRSY